MTNAEMMAKKCPYDILVEMNKKLMRNSEGEYCIMQALPYKGKCLGNCPECIRIWRLEEVK